MINGTSGDKPRHQYGEQMRLRRAGIPSQLGSTATLNEAKPHFFADAHLLIDEVREVYASFKDIAPPYGLFDRKGVPFEEFDSSSRHSAWIQLEQLLSATSHRAFEIVTPPISACPYHEGLKNIGHTSVRAEVEAAPDVEWLRDATFPGAMLAPATIVNIYKRFPAIAAINGSTLDRNKFMPEEVIRAYTKLGKNKAGQEAIVWSMPTDDFVLRAEVDVADRQRGHERDIRGDHITTYPIGTRLGDIEVTEPTIGCPGSMMAYDMVDQTIDVIVGKNMWQTAA